MVFFYRKERERRRYWFGILHRLVQAVQLKHKLHTILWSEHDQILGKTYQIQKRKGNICQFEKQKFKRRHPHNMAKTWSKSGGKKVRSESEPDDWKVKVKFKVTLKKILSDSPWKIPWKEDENITSEKQWDRKHRRWLSCVLNFQNGNQGLKGPRWLLRGVLYRS